MTYSQAQRISTQTTVTQGWVQCVPQRGVRVKKERIYKAGHGLTVNGSTGITINICIDVPFIGIIISAFSLIEVLSPPRDSRQPLMHIFSLMFIFLPTHLIFIKFRTEILALTSLHSSYIYCLWWRLSFELQKPLLPTLSYENLFYPSPFYCGFPSLMQKA